MRVQSFTLQGSFNVRLLKGEGFSVLTFFVTSELLWQTIVVQFATCTRVMCKLASSAHELRMDFSVN